jgi:hypothetical protein
MGQGHRQSTRKPCATIEDVRESTRSPKRGSAQTIATDVLIVDVVVAMLTLAIVNRSATKDVIAQTQGVYDMPSMPKPQPT